MTDFNVRSDSVDVEQIMRQIRARIREKRGVDYTEEEIRELAGVKLEKFLDPRGVRSDLLQQFRRSRAAMPAPPNFAFEDSTLYESHRGIVRSIRKLLNPILKLFFNPNPLIQALHIQSQLNTRNAQREELDSLHYEVMHNLVVEITRLGIEVKNLKMRLESMSSRLDFDERRARALEGVVQYRPGAVAPLQPPTGAASGGAAGEQAGGPDSPDRRTRRRRRRGRKRPMGAELPSRSEAGGAFGGAAGRTEAAGPSRAPAGGDDALESPDAASPRFADSEGTRPEPSEVSDQAGTAPNREAAADRGPEKGGDTGTAQTGGGDGDGAAASPQRGSSDAS